MTGKGKSKDICAPTKERQITVLLVTGVKGNEIKCQEFIGNEKMV